MAFPLAFVCREALGLSPPRESVLALPDELILAVLRLAEGAKELCAVARTCRKMDRLANDPGLWKNFLKR